MIINLTMQAASVGIGIDKEGKQASLAKDFSISQLSPIGRLLLVHSRKNYKKSVSHSLGTHYYLHVGLSVQ